MSYQYQQFSVSIVGKDSADGRFRPLKTFKHQGKVLAIGEAGTEYAIVVRNHRGDRCEAVISVDGIDVLTGKTASVYARGYVIDGGSFLHLTGFRTDDRHVASFTFGDVESSYAAAKGNTSTVGVIGVAVYREKPTPKVTYRSGWVNASYKGGQHTNHMRGGIIMGDHGGFDPQATYGLVDTPSAMFMGVDNGSQPVDTGYITTTSCVMNDAGGAHSVEPAKDLGTQFGREQESYTQEVMFERAASTPDEVFRVYYNSYAAMVAMGIPVPTMPEPMVRAKLNVDPFPATPKHGYCEPPKGWEG